MAFPLEVMEERALRQAGARDDIVERGAGKTLLQDQRLRHRQDPLARLFAFVCHADSRLYGT
jgi:hypothetical protein